MIIKASVCTNSNDIMAQIAMVSQVQRNSQRGVGTACQSREGSHSQGCHWRKRLESCIEIERDKDRRERERRNGRTKRRGKQGWDTLRMTEGTVGEGKGGGVAGWRDPRTGNRKEGERAVRNIARKNTAQCSLSARAPLALKHQAYRPLLTVDALQDLHNNLQLHAFSAGCDSPVPFQL